MVACFLALVVAICAFEIGAYETTPSHSPTSSSTLAPTLIPNAHINSISAIINTARRKVGATNMVEAKYDPTFSKVLEEFRDAKGPYWIYTLSAISNATIPDVFGKRHDLNKFYFKNDPLFLSLCEKHGMLSQVQNSFLYPMHDTYTTKRGAPRIFKLRAAQPHCVNYRNCLQGQFFTNFRACAPTELEEMFSVLSRPQYQVLLDRTRCRGWWWYYPWMVHHRVFKFGLISLGVRGSFAQDRSKQDNAFLAVLLLHGGPNFPSDDIPYEVGRAPCSNCPLQFPNCSQKLCVP